MRGRLLFGVLLGLTLYPQMLFAEDHLTRISCPLHWPGPDGKALPLRASTPWYDHDAMFGGWDEVVPPEYETSILLDCAYGYSPRHRSLDDGDKSPFRVTLHVPGHVKRCKGANFPVAKGVWQDPMTCWTLSEPGQTLPPPQTFPAEQITGSTSLEGFGLNKSPQLITQWASEQGYACTTVNPTEISCHRDQEQINVLFRNDRSVRVELSVPWERNQPDTRHKALVFRFGLPRQYPVSGPDYFMQEWRGPGSSFRIAEMVHDHEMQIQLADLSKIEAEDHRWTLAQILYPDNPTDQSNRPGKRYVSAKTVRSFFWGLDRAGYVIDENNRHLRRSTALTVVAAPQLGPARYWVQGARITGPNDPNLQPGTVIGQGFGRNGNYIDRPHGTHTAIVVGQNDAGDVRIIDQYDDGNGQAQPALEHFLKPGEETRYWVITRKGGGMVGVRGFEPPAPSSRS